MKRRLASALLLASAMTLPVESASALGLGKITLKSSLNQPLQAEVELRKLGTLNEEQVLARLASNAEFERAGVDRTFFHSQLRFNVELDGQGSGTLHISTRTPVKEPFLDFLIETRWPKGRLVRGYTVLLDLPHVVRKRTQVAESVSASAPQADTGQSSYSSVSTPATSSMPSGDVYTVKSGDSLWKIARQNKMPGKSINDTMAALYENNPDAFVNGDRNQLKAGAVLRLPGQSSASSAPVAEDSVSVATVPDKPQIDAVEASSSPAPVVETEDQTGHLTLSSAPEADSSSSMSGTGEADSGVVDQLQEELTANEEQLALVEREKEELRDKLSSLEEEVQTLQELVDLKNNQLAEAQSGAEQPAAETVVQTVVEDKPDNFSQWLKNPLTWVTGGIALLALLALVFFRRKPEEEQALPAVAAQPAASLDEELDVDLDEVSLDDDTQEATEIGDEEDLSAADGDAASEADIYIAYGRFDQAADVLTRALDADPDNEEVRLKLAEVYVDGKMKDEYLALLSLAEDSAAEGLVIKMKSLLDGNPEAQAWVGEEVTPLAEEESLELDVGKLSTDEDDSYTSDAASEVTETETEEESFDTLDLPEATDDYSTEDELPGGDDTRSALEDEAPLLDDFDMDATSAEDSSLSDALHLTEEEEEGASVKEEPAEAKPEPEPEPEPEFSDEEEVETKLELASAYIDMGDYDGARDILEEVLEEGNDDQKARAQELLEQVD